MTEVQKRSIPSLLTGSDALIKSQTGSGKTLCYSVPLVQRLRSHEPRITRKDGTFALILVPTRELALQSLAVIKKLVQVGSLFQRKLQTSCRCVTGMQGVLASVIRLKLCMYLLFFATQLCIDHQSNKEIFAS